MAASRRPPPRPFPHPPLPVPAGGAATAAHTGWANDLLSPAPCLRIDPAASTAACIATATATLTVCLLLTQYYPGRFHIHPLPYVSDAGLRDPERFLLGAGLSLSGALFLPLAVAVRLHQRSLLPTLPARVPLTVAGGRDGACVAASTVAAAVEVAGRAAWGVPLFLVATATVPGRWLAHHAVAAAFALCGAVWGGCSVGTLWVVSAGGGGGRGGGAPRLGAGALTGGGGGGGAAAAGAWTASGAGTPGGSRGRHVTIAVYLSALLCAVIVVFVAVWATVRLDMPPKIKNKDKRFVVMAILEYIGTGCFLSVLAVLAAEVRGRVLVISLADAVGGRAG